MSEFDVLVGKRINGLFIGDDAWSLVFRDINGRHYCFRTQNDCCNRSYDFEMDNYSAKNIDTLNRHGFNFNYEFFEL